MHKNGDDNIIDAGRKQEPERVQSEQFGGLGTERQESD